MSSIRVITRRIAALSALSILIAACGGTATSTTEGVADPAGSPVGVSAAARDFEFVPDTWTVPAGTLLALDFENQGGINHTITIMNDGVVINSSAEFDPSLVFRELRADPGASASDTFLSPTEPGTYQVICAIPGHLEAGMTAELIVEG